FGQQSETAARWALTWIRRRLNWTTGAMFRALAARDYPLILVDKSPTNAESPACLRRLQRTVPGAGFLHLLRHPRGHGTAALDALREIGIDGESLHASLAAGGDPQQLWYSFHSRICTFLAPFSPLRKLRLRGEDVLANPDRSLAEICGWLGIRTDHEAIEQMKHPEQSPIACIGPPCAALGNDLHFLKQPALRVSRGKPQWLEGPLDWRT